MIPSDKLAELDKKLSGFKVSSDEDAIHWLINRVRVLTEALEKIAAPKYGLDMSDPHGVARKYWFDLLIMDREIARRALEGDET